MRAEEEVRKAKCAAPNCPRHGAPAGSGRSLVRQAASPSPFAIAAPAGLRSWRPPRLAPAIPVLPIGSNNSSGLSRIEQFVVGDKLLGCARVLAVKQVERFRLRAPCATPRSPQSSTPHLSSVQLKLPGRSVKCRLSAVTQGRDRRASCDWREGSVSMTSGRTRCRALGCGCSSSPSRPAAAYHRR